MANDGLPTILLVPGGFALPSCYNRLLPHLHQSGYPTVVASIPSCNAADPSTVSCSNDAAYVREKFLVPLCDEGHSVVIFVHSYGGIVGGAAALRLNKSLRVARGEIGGVIGLVYLVGNIVLENESLLQTIGGAWPPYIKNDTVCVLSTALQLSCSSLTSNIAQPRILSHSSCYGYALR
jgi:pimeloyl-ACP methyl ester carboxylesterase